MTSFHSSDPSRLPTWPRGISLRPWTRRAWLTQASSAIGLAAVGGFGGGPGTWARLAGRHVPAIDAATCARLAAQATRIDPGPLQTLAQRAVDAARTAGADYADARLTRTVQHSYGFDDLFLDDDEELLGVGVRVLAQGGWGFAASPVWAADEVVRLAQDAVTQARANVLGTTPPPVTLGTIPVATGTWTTPVRIDPFTVTIEEKLDHMFYWQQCAKKLKLKIELGAKMQFVRQERVVATSDGACFTQTLYESQGQVSVAPISKLSFGPNPDIICPKLNGFVVPGLEWAGKGWELLLDQLPAAFPRIADEIWRAKQMGKPARVGRYTLVCDGATMAALLDKTLGLATQLDRALGYEANGGGTSFLTDPLGMLGSFQVASPLVTVTTNRSAAAQLATVQWDDEGVVPSEATLVKDGVLTDFQTTREQAAWLAPYYAKAGRPVRSNGCAAAQDALSITMQHMPNLALAPGKSVLGLADLVANVKEGILIVGGGVESDFQQQGGLLGGTMREIKNGRLGSFLSGGAVLFNTRDLWQHVIALGGPATVGTYGVSQYDGGGEDGKGEPMQCTSHSVQAVAATIVNQPLINPMRKA